MARKQRRSSQPKPAAADGHSGSNLRYEVALSSRTLPQALLIAALLLLALHTALYFYHYRIDKLSWVLLQLFDVDQENNLPSWYSGIVLALTSCLLWVCAHEQRPHGGAWVRHWYALSIGFLLLPLDEIAGVHESINSVIVMSWAIPAGILAAGIGLLFVPFMLHLPRRTAQLFAVAATAYLVGAIALEIVGNDMVGRGLRDSLGYKLTTAVEESFEMLGIVLFVYALLAYMRAPAGDAVRMSVEIP